jgi:predicted nuclease of predicted toxin-antitoxin system
VKLLLDQNLSRNLVGRLQGAYPDSTHVSALGLAMATDREVWDFAGQQGYTIVSKDSDFRQLAFLHGPPPKVIWLRAGNANTSTVLEVLLSHHEALDAFGTAADEALLVLPGLPQI